MNQFENMTIGELRKLTEEYKELEKDNKILNVKYPMKLKKTKPIVSAQDIVDQVGAK